jgi:hypothetical protein
MAKCSFFFRLPVLELVAGLGPHSSLLTRRWRKTASNHRSRRERDGRGGAVCGQPSSSRETGCLNDPIQLIGPPGNSQETLFARAGPMVRIRFPPAASQRRTPKSAPLRRSSLRPNSSSKMHPLDSVESLLQTIGPRRRPQLVPHAHCDPPIAHCAVGIGFGDELVERLSVPERMEGGERGIKPWLQIRVAGDREAYLSAARH